MNQVIRNCTHGSKIILSICENDGRKFFKKSSYSEEGIEALKKEYEGYVWYINKINQSISIRKRNIDNNYLELNIPHIETKTSIRKKLNKRNLKFFYRAIDHYKNVWMLCEPQNDLYPVHGDYSLEGNILFNEEKVFVIDWEHFNQASAPLGYDILFMIFESLKIKIGFKIPKKNLLKMASELIIYAYNNHCLDECFNKDFLSSFISFQESIHKNWGQQKDKLPTTQFNSEQLIYMVPYFRFNL